MNDPGDTFDVEIEGMANGGDALARHEGRVVFLPYAIPGEVVRARLVEARKAIDFAEGVELVEASADRVYAECPHFGPGRCWGCQWQHMHYEAQLLLKFDVFADQLSRIGKFSDDVLEAALQRVVPSPQLWGYNSQMTFERGPDGTLGFWRRNQAGVHPVDVCLVLHPDLQALYDLIDIDFDEMTGMTLWRGSAGETMIDLQVRSEDVPELSADLPTSINVILPNQEPVNLIGDTFVRFAVGGVSFRMTTGGSFRANVPQVENLVAETSRHLDLREGSRVLDLYAGVGTFSAFMAERARLVTLVEAYPPAVNDAEHNLAQYENVDIIDGPVESVLSSLASAYQRYDAAVIDPPSQGVERGVPDMLAELGVKRVAYISDDIATLSRDARQFVRLGFHLALLQPFDFAPHTYGAVSLAIFTKR